MYIVLSLISSELSSKIYCKTKIGLQVTKVNLIKLYITIRRMAENGFAPPPLGNFADISYLVEN